jgi:hypothetical protein
LSAVRSSSDWSRVFSRLATISNSEAPTDEASAEAEPPPGVGSADANAAITSRSGVELSTAYPISMIRPFLITV